MTRAEERAAKADLKRKVRELMKDVNKLAEKKLESLIKSGAGVVDDHHANALSLRTPKDFIYVLGKEISDQYGGRYSTPEERGRVHNYYIMM